MLPHRIQAVFCCALALWLLGPGTCPGWSGEAPAIARAPDVAIVQLRVVGGDGAVHAPGSRSTVPLVVQVTDEVGRPLAGVAVSFQMPGAGASGTFADGLRTDVLLTDAAGRVTVRGIRWGKTPGPARIRITAMAGKARAGIISTQYVEAVSHRGRAARSGRHLSISKPHGKWFAIALIAAGAAAGGLALGLAGKSSSPPAAAAAATAAKTSGVQVGVPTITIGKP